MAGEVIDEAYVEIKSRVAASFSADISRAVAAALRPVAATVDRAMSGASASIQSGIEDPFRDASRSVDRSLNNVATSANTAFEQVENSASSSLNAVEASVRGATGDIDRHFDQAARDADASFEKVERSAEENSGRISGSFGKAAGLIAGSLAALGGISALKGFVSDAEEARVIGELTANTIEGMGNAANISADQVGELAGAIAMKTGADDGAIQTGANMLLTFGNIRNEVGKGRDIFNQATATVTDMVAALNNGDVSASALKSQSIQLGKALNDPIKGTAALSKVGVAFSDEQKKQIKGFVEAGDMASAQGVILEELGKQFGGAAQAAAGPMGILQNSIGEVGESIGAALLPGLAKISTGLNDALPGILNFAGEIGSKITPVLHDAFDAVAPIVQTAIDRVVIIFQALLPAVQTVFDTLAPIVASVIGTITPILEDLNGVLADRLGPAFAAIAGLVQALAPAFGLVAGAAAGLLAVVAPALVPAMDALLVAFTAIVDAASAVVEFLNKNIPVVLALAAATLALSANYIASTVAMVAFAAVSKGLLAVQKAAAAAQWLLNVAMSANPIGLVVAAIALLVGGLILAYQKSETFRNIVNAVGQALMTGLKAALDFVSGAFQFLKTHIDTIINVVLVLLGPIGAVILVIKNWGAITDAVGAAIGAAVQWIVDKFNAAVGAVTGAVRAIGNAIRSGFNAVVNFITSMMARIGNAILSGFERAKAAITAAMAAIRNIISGAASAVIGVVSGFIGRVVGFYASLPGKAVGALRSLGSSLRGVFSGAFSAVSSFITERINNIITNFQSIPTKITDLGSKMLEAGKSIIGKVFEGIRSAASGAGGLVADIGRAIKDAINSALHLPFKIGFNPPGPGSFEFTIPAFAKGGIVDKAIFAVLGEAGPEAVIPLTKPARAAHLIAESGLARMQPVQAAVLAEMANTQALAGLGGRGVERQEPLRTPLARVRPGAAQQRATSTPVLSGSSAVPGRQTTVTNNNTFILPPVMDVNVLAAQINDRAAAYAER